MNVPRALLRGPDGLRQNCRTANGEVADMGLQTGENLSSAGLNARAQGLDIGGAIPLRGEYPFLRARAHRTRKQQRCAERDRSKSCLHDRISLQFYDEHPRPPGCPSGRFSCFACASLILRALPLRALPRASCVSSRYGGCGGWRAATGAAPFRASRSSRASRRSRSSGRQRLKPSALRILRRPPAREAKPFFAAKALWFLVGRSLPSSLLAGLLRPPLETEFCPNSA